MGGHLTYEESKKLVVKGLILLGVLTIVEVFIALLCNGHIVESIDVAGTSWRYLYMVIMVAMSLYKAYFIVYEFMHMRYEVKGLAMSVLLPTFLLVWGVIAFFNEGASWNSRRDVIKERDKYEEEKSPKVLGLHHDVHDTWELTKKDII